MPLVCRVAQQTLDLGFGASLVAGASADERSPDIAAHTTHHMTRDHSDMRIFAPPPRRFADVGTGNRVRQLRTPKGALPDSPREVRVRPESNGRTSASRNHQADKLRMAPSHQAHRLREITVVAHHDRAIVGVQPAVVQEMYCKIDVRPLFFGLDHLRRPRVSNRARQRHSNTVAQEVPEVDFHLGPIVLKRPKIDVLTLRLRGIVGRARHSRREILDPQDIVMRLQHLREQRRQVKPFPRRSLERSVVQIEPVYVKERAHRQPLQKQGPPKRPRALRSKPQGVLPLI